MIALIQGYNNFLLKMQEHNINKISVMMTKKLIKFLKLNSFLIIPNSYQKAD
jgi:hypothetical protein